MDPNFWYNVSSVVISHLNDPYIEALATLSTKATYTSLTDATIMEILHHVAKSEEYSFFRDIAYHELAYRRIVRVYAAESDDNTILFWDDSWSDSKEFDNYKEFYEYLTSIRHQIRLDK